PPAAPPVRSPSAAVKALVAVQKRWHQLMEQDAHEGADSVPGEVRAPTASSGSGLPLLDLDAASWARLLVAAFERASSSAGTPSSPLEIGIGRDRLSVVAECAQNLDEPFDHATVIAGGTDSVDRGSTIKRWDLRRRAADFASVPDAACGGPAQMVQLPRSISELTGPSDRATPVDVEVQLLSLSEARSVAIDAEPSTTADLLCRMVVDAATRKWSDGGDVVVVGFGEAMHGLDGIKAVPDLGEALGLIRSRVAGSGNRVALFLGAASVDGASEEEVAALESLIADGEQDSNHDAATVALVTGVPWKGARYVIAVDEVTEEIGLRRRIYRSSDEAVDAVAPPAAPGGLVVNVLGPVEVQGTATPLDRRPKLTELVVYLALHPRGATSDAWATALWPDRRMPVSTLSNRLSEARAALGTASDGYAHLRKQGSRYVLGPDATTDWDRFNDFAGSSDPADWRRGLELVRGRPFEGLREAQWTLLEGAVPTIEATVVELACRAAGRWLSEADVRSAQWAARKAMLVCPWDERLTRILMRCADAMGNRAGVEAALRHLGSILECPHEPLRVVHPETAGLYRELVAKRG
ncbi:MAG TPA: bacterial transcriptional activator domain-containing protein, partial [Acidimicrobiales bacterium]|nr:bacterial transcriptional activator domain-containing protein [Acidimicrobiales bacterium]